MSETNKEKNSVSNNKDTKKTTSSDTKKVAVKQNDNRAGSTKKTSSKSSVNRKKTSSKSSVNRKKSSSGKKKKKQGWLTPSKIFIIGAVVVGILAAWIVTLIMRASMFKVKQLQTGYVLGTKFDINNYVDPVKEDVAVVYDSSSFKADNVGEMEIKYQLRRGKLKTTKTLKIEVQDMDVPVINGPEEVSFVAGDDIDWSLFYNVTDSQPDLEKNIESNIDIDSSKAGTYEITLKVTDWVGNNSEKNITVNVVEMEENEAIAARALTHYKSDFNINLSERKVYVLNFKDAPENGLIAYVLIGDDVIYNVYDDGRYEYYNFDSTDDTESVEFYYRVQDITGNGVEIDSSKLSNFF